MENKPHINVQQTEPREKAGWTYSLEETTLLDDGVAPTIYLEMIKTRTNRFFKKINHITHSINNTKLTSFKKVKMIDSHSNIRAFIIIYRTPILLKGVCVCFFFKKKRHFCQSGTIDKGQMIGE